MSVGGLGSGAANIAAAATAAATAAAGCMHYRLQIRQLALQQLQQLF